MAAGDVHEVTTGECTDLYYVDTGMYDVDGYGAVYVIDDDRPAVVDTGIGTNHERVLDAIESVGIDREELDVIAPTHVHLDHAGGAGYLAEACPNAEVYVHRIGAPHLVDPSRLVEGTKRAVGDQWEFYVEPRPVPEGRIVEIEGGDRIDLGTHELIAHHAPGHAPHQVVFEDPANDAVFTADAAGLYVPELDEVHPTSPPPNFDLEACLADIETLRGIDPSTLLYAHFGPAGRGDRLDEYEEVISDWVRSIVAAREELGEDDEAVVERFVAEAVEETGDIWGERKARAETRMNVEGVLHYLDRRDG